MHRYFLKEYGSWGVMTMAYLTGLVAAPQVNMKAFAGFFALAFLINAKQAATIWMRTAAEKGIAPGIIFAIQILIASALLFPLYQQYDFLSLLPFAVFPASYLLSLKVFGEHAIITEVLGFVLLSLAALAAKAIVGSGLDTNLFIVIAVFFVAGVFRVRIQLRKKIRYRVVMFCYVGVAAGFFYLMGYRTVLLLPLVDNLVFALTLYRVGLQATGWIEMAKGFAFLLLIAAFGY
ncbi:MAG: hypothetical protein HZA15_03835 [Nitrospirae bacterium]|nr:hypothetical protein [Nitrospirota bacterium]